MTSVGGEPEAERDSVIAEELKAADDALKQLRAGAAVDKAFSLVDVAKTRLPSLDEMFSNLGLAPSQAGQAPHDAAPPGALPQVPHLAASPAGAVPDQAPPQRRRFKRVVRTSTGKERQAPGPTPTEGPPVSVAPAQAPQPAEAPFGMPDEGSTGSAGGGAQRAAPPTIPAAAPMRQLHVELPELPQRGGPHPAASHGSAKSTLAMRGKAAAGDSDSDDSITSPDNAPQSAGFPPATTGAGP